MEYEICDKKPTWQGKNAVYDLRWCSLCRVFSITKRGSCECHGSTCNGGGCAKCLEDFALFEKDKKYRITDYLSKEEFLVYEKIMKLQELMLESLSRDEQAINWQQLVETGQLSNHEKKNFKQFFK